MPKEKETKLQFRLPLEGYSKTLYANRVRIESVEGGKLCVFALFDNRMGVIDQAGLFLSSFALQQNRKSLLDYVQRVPKDPPDPELFPAPLGVGKACLFPDIIGTTANDQEAEIAFALMPTVAAVNRSKTDDKENVFDAQGLALIRCSIAVQRYFIKELYA